MSSCTSLFSGLSARRQALYVLASLNSSSRALWSRFILQQQQQDATIDAALQRDLAKLVDLEQEAALRDLESGMSSNASGSGSSSSSSSSRGGGGGGGGGGRGGEESTAARSKFVSLDVLHLCVMQFALTGSSWLGSLAILSLTNLAGANLLDFGDHNRWLDDLHECLQPLVAALVSSSSNVHLMRLGVAYFRAIGTLAERYANRKKLFGVYTKKSNYLSHIVSLLDAVLSTIEHEDGKGEGEEQVQEYKLALTSALDLVVEHCVLDSKQIEDISQAAELQQQQQRVPAVVGEKEGTSSFEPSAASFFFSCLSSNCSSPSSKGLGIARVFENYARCSKMLAAQTTQQQQQQQHQQQRLQHERLAAASSISSALADRKHVARVLEVSLALLSTDAIAAHSLVRNVLLKQLSSSVEGAIPNHDSLRPLVLRLHAFSGHLLDSLHAQSQAQAHVQNSRDDDSSAMSIAHDLEALRVLASIDHRLLQGAKQQQLQPHSKRKKGEESSSAAVVVEEERLLHEYVLESIFTPSSNSMSLQASASTTGQQLLQDEKQALLLAVISLHADLRRLDALVSDLCSRNDHDDVHLAASSALLQASKVQSSLSHAFSELPGPQAAAVWQALAADNAHIVFSSLLLQAFAFATLSSPSSSSSLVLSISPPDLTKMLEKASNSLEEAARPKTINKKNKLRASTSSSSSSSASSSSSSLSLVSRRAALVSCACLLRMATFSLSFSSPADLAPEGAWFAFLLLSRTRLASCTAIIAPFDGDLSVLGCSVLFALSALLANANARQAGHGKKRALGAMEEEEEEEEKEDEDIGIEQILGRIDENMLRAILAGCNLASSFVSSASSDDAEVARTTSKGKGKGKRKAQEEAIAAAPDATTSSSSSCHRCQEKFVVDVLLLLLQTNSIWAHLHDQLFTKEPARSQLVCLLVSFLEAKHYDSFPGCSTCSSSSNSSSSSSSSSSCISSGSRDAALRQLQSVSVRDFASLASVFRVAVDTCLLRLHSSLEKCISQQQHQQQHQAAKHCVEMLCFLVENVPNSLWLIDQDDFRKESTTMKKNPRLNGGDEKSDSGGKLHDEDEDMQVDDHSNEEEAAPAHLMFEIVSLVASSLATSRSGSINNNFTSMLVQILEVASKALVPFLRATRALPFTRHLMHRFADKNGLYGHLVNQATKNRDSSSSSSNGRRNLLEMVALLANELLCAKYSSSSSQQEREDEEEEEEGDAVLAVLLATGIKALEVEDGDSPAMYLFQVTCTSLSALPWSLIKAEAEAKAEAGVVEAETDKQQKVAKGKKPKQKQQTMAGRVMTQVETLLAAIAKHCFEGAHNSSSHQAVMYLVKGQALRLLVSLDMLASHPQTLSRLLGNETSKLARGWIFFTGSLLHAQRAAGHMLLPAVSQALVQQVSLAFSLLRDDDDSSKQEHVSLLVTGLLFCTERIAVPRVCDSLVGSCCGGAVSCSPLVAAQIASALLESSSLARSHVGSHSLTASRLLLESASARSLLARRDFNESSHQSTRAAYAERFEAEELLQISRALLYGMSLYKQRKGKGREKRGGGDETDAKGGGGGSKEDDAASAWSSWTSSCIKVLASLATRVASLDSELPAGSPFGSRAQMSSHVLAVLEQLLSGPSNALIGTCIASICLTLSQLAHVCLGDYAALGAARRVLIAAAASADACKHAHMLCVAMLELLAACPSSTSREDVEALSPGVFALFDRCNSRQRKQIFAMLGTQGRAVYSDVHTTYLRDYKFKGKA